MSTPPATDLSTLEIVEELEELVGTARRVPLSANVIVNEDETLELVDRLRVSLPEELVQARHTLEDRERIVGSAREEAEQVAARAEHEAQQLLARADAEAQRLVHEAGERAAQMVAESEVMRQAHAHAAQLVTDAETQVASIRAEADAYARDVMQQLEEQLVRALGTVRKGIEALPAPDAPARARGKGRRG